MTGFHGTPCWYELSTSDLAAGQDFYTRVLGWAVTDAGMEGFDYRLANAGGDMVAGMMTLPAPGIPPHWLIYFAVDGCNATAAAITAAGGKVIKEPADIPGTGRFAVASDPQGAYFGILEPAPMDTPPTSGAFDQKKTGHGNWTELMTSDPKAGFAFYNGLFGWTADQAMDMGSMGIYQIFADKGTAIGGMMGLGNAPMPAWLAYFGVDGTDAAIARITAAGGAIVHGPQEVPGGAFIAVARDPQGAHFAVVGPR